MITENKNGGDLPGLQCTALCLICSMLRYWQYLTLEETFEEQGPLPNINMLVRHATDLYLSPVSYFLEYEAQ
jgi:hypothetical protein